MLGDECVGDSGCVEAGWGGDAGAKNEISEGILLLVGSALAGLVLDVVGAFMLACCDG